ncbi:hypothetical protein D3C80_1221540 [compost metagenome]
MGRQPIQFLAHIRLGGQGGGFKEDSLVQTGRVGRQFADPAGEAFADGLGLAGGLQFGARDQGLDGPDEVVDDRRQLLALALTRLLQRVQRLFDGDGDSGFDRGLAFRVLDRLGHLDDAA